MSIRVSKTAPKMFITKSHKIQELVIHTMERIASAVGSSMGPGGRVSLLEASQPGFPNKVTKDGVTILKNLGSTDSYEHLIIETAVSSSMRTATEAGDGTTTTCVLGYEFIKNIFDFCEKNPKESPQKVVRRMKEVVQKTLLPYIAERSIKITEDNKALLTAVATISANGEKELANAVIQCFEEVGFGESSHVTIREVPGPFSYNVTRIEGFPIPMGYEETSGKYHTSFINDQGNQRCFLEKPKFILFDGAINDLVQFAPVFNAIDERHAKGEKGFHNVVLVANGFSETVISTLAFNFEQQGTLKIIPIRSPMSQFLNCQTHFLGDLASVTSAKIFGLKNQIMDATVDDLGSGMESFECYRFRSTVVGSSDPVNIEVRCDDIKKMATRAESQAERTWFEERSATISSGIAKLTISGGNASEIKERSDRAEDAVCAVRAAISAGVVPGGTRIALDMALLLASDLPEGDAAREIMMPSLLSLTHRLLENAGYNEEENQEVLVKLIRDPELIYDIEAQEYGKFMELGVFDATKAVSESLSNALALGGILGTLGGIVAFPRDNEFERSEAKADNEYMRAVENPDAFQNPALRGR